jgi:hypothetical protein
MAAKSRSARGYHSAGITTIDNRPRHGHRHHVRSPLLVIVQKPSKLNPKHLVPLGLMANAFG